MIDHGSRSTWCPGPSGSRLQIQNCDLLPLKQGHPTTFVLLSLHQVEWLRLQRHARPHLGPPDLGGWGMDQIPATNLSPIEEYPHAKFH